MDLFGFKVRFSDDPVTGESVPDLVNGSFPDSTFNTFIEAFLSVFIVMANDGWTTIYFNHYRSVGAATSTLFFVSLLLIGQYIMLNLFLAILLQRFD